MVTGRPPVAAYGQFNAGVNPGYAQTSTYSQTTVTTSTPAYGAPQQAFGSAINNNAGFGQPGYGAPGQPRPAGPVGQPGYGTPGQQGFGGQGQTGFGNQPGQ